jgi:hypothetical protein
MTMHWDVRDVQYYWYCTSCGTLHPSGRMFSYGRLCPECFERGCSPSAHPQRTTHNVATRPMPVHPTQRYRQGPGGELTWG